ncbi:CAP domain-containing protein [Flagellimonas meridianipacifica]|uniref:Cysteine-rich secretory protein family protein n=1 Tax=Flagellimonas meridianipacifica TaxID=1080225 RepID=A0A2T0MGL5_9FLAO|nr:CAP domain-containing protein [Allomuricauda pacifica]PRX56727.1 Cysteine-rich secretory protein family protein [Allomuricauda pacifica]
MKKLSTAAITAVLAIILITCSKSSATSEQEIIANNQESISKAEVNASQLETELLDMINEHRASIGVDALKASSEVYPFAEDHNSYMIAQNKLSHDNFESRAAQITVRTDAIRIAENVARHYSSAQLALSGWLESSDHKGTLEGNYTHTALSVVLDKEGRPYFTQIFMLVE